MRKGFKLISLLLVATLLCLALSINALGAEQDATPCEIMDAFGGADGIISMTFDDGYYETALVLDELFRRYELTGSVMMIVKSLMNKDGELVNLEKWQTLLKNSSIKIQNHSYNHINLGNNGDPSLQTEEVFYHEMIESKELLEELFPGNDIITYATPYGGMTDKAHEYIKDEYFAIRTTQYGVQTLNPGFGDKLGDWKWLYSPVVVPYAEGTDQWTWIKNTIDSSVGGWYVPIIHRVGDVELADLSYDMAEKMFAYIASLRDEGKAWVTDFETATKYVRERQNAKAYVKEINGTLYVSVEMDEYTADNMYLAPEIFDTPLTVKVPITDKYTDVFYTVDGVEYVASAFDEGGVDYAYINIEPNTEIALRNSFSHTMGDFEKCDEEHHKKVCTDCGYIVYYEHSFDEGEVTLEPTHLATGVRTCICTVCGEDGAFDIDKIQVHTFDKEVKKGEYLKNYATCTTSREYYYSCECGARGEETFFSGNPLGHNHGEWEIVVEPTDNEDGLKARTCRCGDREEEMLPRLNQSATGDEDEGEKGENKNENTLTIAIVSGAIVLTCVGIAFVLFLKKREK